jgi:hypothetical protein
MACSALTIPPELEADGAPRRHLAPKPPALTIAAGATQVPNPAYERWYNQDQQLLSGLLSSMSKEDLRDVVHATSSREV